MTEQQIQQAILLALGSSKMCRVWRINAGVSRSLTGARVIKGAPKGHPDIAGMLSDGRALFIEVKKPGEKQTDQQKTFEAMVKRFQGVYLLAHSVEEAEQGVIDSLAVN